MFYHRETGLYINQGQAFSLNGIQHMQGWISFSDNELETMGLIEVKEVGVRESTETHYVTEELVDGELRITSTRKPDEVIAQQQAPSLQTAITTFKAKRRLALDSLTGIGARANWKSDRELADLCYNTQEALLLLHKDLPILAKEAIVELKTRYDKLKQETAQANATLATAFPELYL